MDKHDDCFFALTDLGRLQNERTIERRRFDTRRKIVSREREHTHCHNRSPGKTQVIQLESTHEIIRSRGFETVRATITHCGAGQTLAPVIDQSEFGELRFTWISGLAAEWRFSSAKRRYSALLAAEMDFLKPSPKASGGHAITSDAHP